MCVCVCVYARACMRVYMSERWSMCMRMQSFIHVCTLYTYCVQLSGSVGMIPITVIAAKAHGNLITIKGSTNTVCNAYHNYYTS